MIYGTAHDELNGHGPGLRGLAYLSPNPRYGMKSSSSDMSGVSDSLDIPLSCGIDPNGNPWIMFKNQYFSDLPSLIAYFGPNPYTFNDGGAYYGYSYVQKALANVGAMHMVGAVAHPENDSMAGVVGQLRGMGVPFTAYQPPPSPTITPPQATTYTIQPAVVSFVPPAGYVAAQVVKNPQSYTGYSLKMGPVLIDLAAYMVTDNHAYQIDGGVIHWLNATTGQKADFANPGYVPPIITPPGYQVLMENVQFAYPLYAQAPTINENGTTSFAGATPFYGLTTAPAFGQTGAFLGLDKTKLEAGLYAYKLTEMGTITSPAARQYELAQIDIIDLTNNKSIGPFFQTYEGGGGPHFLEKYAPEILRAITTAGSAGMTEIIHATDKDLAKKVDLYVGGSSIAAGTAVVTTIATGGTGTAAAVAAVIAALAETTQIAVVKPNADQVITSAIINGAVTGVLAGAASNLSQANAVADAVNGVTPAAGPIPYNPASSSWLPVTPEVAAMNAAGSTLLPPSLSLIAPASLDALSAVVVGGGSTVVTSSIIPKAVSGATTAAGGAIKKIATTLGTSALTAEIKKLTGQLPGGAMPPSSSLTINAAPVATDTAAPAASAPSALTWGLGLLAAIVVLKKHAS